VAVSLYGVTLAAIAAAVFVLSVHGTAPLAEPHLRWWVIAAGWAVAEACVVHLKFRRSAHSFSLADIPFVFGLLFAGGDDFLAGALIGAAIAYACRRLPLIKLAFNLAQLALAACVAVVIVRALAIPADALAPATWLGMYLATLLTGALTIACIAGAIAITEGGMNVRTLRQMFAMDGVVTATNSSIAIAAVIVVATDPRAVPVLLVPALSVLVLYRAYISERQRHEQLEFLYEANRALSRSPEVAEAIEGLLAKSLEAFRSEIAEVVLFGADGTPLRTTHGPGDERATMVEANREASDELASLVDRDTPVAALVQPIEHAPLRAYLEQRRIRNAMVAMLPGENRMIGTIMLANRFGIERGYGPGGPAPARGARQQRKRCAAIRPARAGGHPAADASGAASTPGVPRSAHGPPQPLPVHGSGQGGTRGQHRRHRRPLHRCRRLQGRQRLARAYHR
jgi:hypothetical protein